MTARRHGMRGFTLITTLFLLVVISSLAAYLVNISTAQHASTALAVDTLRGRHAALAGLEWVAYRIANVSNTCPGVPASMEVEGFAVVVRACTATDVNEAGASYRLFDVTVGAERGAFGDADYVNIALQATLRGVSDMRIPSIPIVFALLSTWLAADAGAVQCGAVFSNAVGTTGGTLELRDDAGLSNTGNRVLATGNLDIRGTANRCDGQPCTASGSNAASLILPPNNVSDDLRGASVGLAPGDHYYDNVEFRDNDTLTVTGSGQVRVHVGRDLRIRDNARIHVNGDPLDLVFLVGDDVRIEDDARVNAMVYAAGRMELRDDAILEGAVVGSQAQLRGNAVATYRSAAALGIPSVCTAGSGGTLHGELDFKIEVGSLTVVDTYAKPDFTRVNFTQEFDEPPLVFTLPTTDGSNSAAHRIRNVDTEGFDIMTLEPDGEDGPHISMSLNYLAVEAGEHDLPGGRKLIAGTLDTRRYQAYGGGSGWESVSFAGRFSTAPAVLGQIQTMANEQESRIPAKPSRPWLTTAIDDVTASGMRIALERSESAKGSVTRDETIAYVAVEPVGRMSFEDSNQQLVEMEVIRTGELLQGWGSCNGNRVGFFKPWAQSPVVLATKNTRDGDGGVGDGDGGWLRRCSTSTTDTRLQVDEVRSKKIGDRNRKHDTRERAGLVMFSGNFVMQARELDHFRLLHDGFGIAGVGEQVTIQACRSADCSQLYTGSVTVTLRPGNAETSWTGSGVLGNQVTFTGGSRTVTLNRTTGGTVTIGLTATPSPNSPTHCFVGATQTCSVTFAATGFAITLADQVSAGDAPGTLSASSCWSDFQSTTMVVDMSARYLDPAIAGPAVSVNGTPLPTDGSPVGIPFTFDGGCSAPLTVNYPDAGQIALDAVHVGTGRLSGLRMTGSQTAVFHPAALVVGATGAAGNPLNATSPTGTPVHPAGAGFTLTVRAVNANGDVTAAYRPQGVDRIVGYVQRSGPVSGFDGILSITGGADIVSRAGVPAGTGDYSAAAIQPTAFVNGVFTDTGARYSEVGLINLYLADQDYFGHPVASAPLAAGRFVPTGFLAAGSLVNRAATPGCAGDSFTYLGEPLRLTATLTAVNASGVVTRNYQGAFAPFTGSGFVAYGGVGPDSVGIVNGSTPLSGRLDLLSAGLGVPWAAGMATLDVAFALRATGAADGPYDTARVGLAFRDRDGVTSAHPDLDVDADSVDEHVLIDTTRLVLGRLSVGNVHGSELRALDVPVAMQFYAGGNQGFTVHAGDHCTPLTAIVLTDADAGDSLVAGDTCIVDDAGASGGNACAAGTAGVQYRGTASGGRYAVSLAPPGAGRTGAVRVFADGPAWSDFDWTGSGMTGPTGIATFGIYNRDFGIIYQRELR